MKKKRWTSSEIENQSGRVAIVTGANSGIGFEAAKALAANGATVVVASRNEGRARQAVSEIRGAAPESIVESMPLDLADLASVKRFVAQFLGRFNRLDLLLNNAGVMMPVKREETADGFELQIGTNHFGHFALAVPLLPLLVRTKGSRIVTVSSSAQNLGEFDLEDLQWTKRPFKRMPSYGASKIANMLFTLKLQQILEDAGASTMTVACHPGWTQTNLQRTTPLIRALGPVLAMKQWQGALPTLYAAVAPEIVSGGYYGPDGMGRMRGFPAPDQPSEAGMDVAAANRLWELSEELVGIELPSL